MDRSERAAKGSGIREMRQDLGLTQLALAELADVSVKTVRNIEKGDTVGQTDSLDKITAALLKTMGEREGVELFEEELHGAVIQYLLTATYKDGRQIQIRVPDAETLHEFIERLMAKPTIATVQAEPGFFSKEAVVEAQDRTQQEAFRAWLGMPRDTEVPPGKATWLITEDGKDDIRDAVAKALEGVDGRVLEEAGPEIAERVAEKVGEVLEAQRAARALADQPYPAKGHWDASGAAVREPFIVLTGKAAASDLLEDQLWKPSAPDVHGTKADVIFGGAIDTAGYFLAAGPIKIAEGIDKLPPRQNEDDEAWKEYLADRESIAAHRGDAEPDEQPSPEDD